MTRSRDTFRADEQFTREPKEPEAGFVMREGNWAHILEEVEGIGSPPRAFRDAGIALISFAAAALLTGIEEFCEARQEETSLSSFFVVCCCVLGVCGFSGILSLCFAKARTGDYRQTKERVIKEMNRIAAQSHRGQFSEPRHQSLEEALKELPSFSKPPPLPPYTPGRNG